jgi:hypothetical protein
MQRLHELEAQRRSLAMAPPGSPGLDREDAMALMAECQELWLRLKRVRETLAVVLGDTNV